MHRLPRDCRCGGVYYDAAGKPLMSEQKTSHTGIGARIPRRELRRLLSGRGRYIDDIKLPRMLHACFVRSPHPHAKLILLDVEEAKRSPGVAAIFTAAEINPRCAPFVAEALNRPGHRSAPQYLLATERALWQGQPIAVVLGESRAEAEDAAELVISEWDALPVISDQLQASAEGAMVIHPELGSNVAFDFTVKDGDPEKAFAEADVVIEEELRFERQTAMTLETRGLIADYDSADESLTVLHAHQSPFQMQEVFSRHLNIPTHKIRVVAPDIGGAFGMKLNVYTDEMAAVVASMLIGRPVKFCVDRLESFTTDSQARDHIIKCRIAVKRNGEISAMEVDDVAAIGAYGMPQRFNVAEGMHVAGLTGAPYAFKHYRARTRSLYVNKSLIGMYRGVGFPLACVLAELLTDLAADAVGIDTVEFKRLNYWPKSSLPCVTTGGQRLETVSFHECLEKLVKLMNYQDLRNEQAELRKQGVYRGIGIATFCEPTAHGPSGYGPSGAWVTSQDGCTLRLETSGAIRCVTSITDQGQGTLTSIAQIVADTVGVSIEEITVTGGDSSAGPHGGGAWASRGAATGGEAALRAGTMLKQNILALASAITQTPVDQLNIVNGEIINRRTEGFVIALAEIGRIGYFRQDTLPPGFDVQLSVTASFVAADKMYYMANGVQASYVEVDHETGFITMLGQWAVDDCGRVINPLLVDEQVRGGVVQGIGAVLFEECVYSEDANLLNGTMADYLVPMAGEMPDILVDHVETAETSTKLGAKGVGEGGLIGAMGSVWVGVNDALKPLGAKIRHQPFTPERVLDALARAKIGQQ